MLHAVLLLAALWLASAPPSPVCSLATFANTRWAAATYVLATARADTLLAGPGNARLAGGGGHSGAGAPRDIYGQMVEVQRFGGADSARIAAAFAARRSRAALFVPWDYNPSCGPTYWSRSARWIEVDRPGAFSLRLRPREHWVGEIPTFDAFTASMEPYPHGTVYRDNLRMPDPRTRPSLTAEEFFELTLALPDSELLRQDSAAAVAHLRRWANEHPELVGRYPSEYMLWYLGLPGRAMQ